MTTILDIVREGKPLTSTPFIDVHGHFGPWPGTVVPWALDHGRLIAEMDRFGCDMVWMSTSDPGYTAPMAMKNDFVLDLAAAHPDRIIAYCTLSSNEPDGCLAELERCVGRGRCIGVKMHRYQQPRYTMKSDFMQPILEVLNEHKLVYLNHCFEDIPALEWALERYPGVTFMSGHFAPWVNDLAVRHANFRDCTCAAAWPEELGRDVRRVGRSDTLLIGSDFGLFCLSFGIGMVAYADMAEADKRNILGLNALKLLERTAWFDRSMLACTEPGGVP